MRKSLLALLTASQLMASCALAQPLVEPLPPGAVLAPPPVRPAAPVVAPGRVSPQPAPFRWGWFGAERHSQPAHWHFDYQYSSMRWRNCK